MNTLLNYWHIIFLIIVFLIFAAGIYVSLKQERKKLIFPMALSVSLISILVTAFGIVSIDKYTKTAKLYKLEKKRMLSIEKIIYTGIVKNEGNHEIGEVTFEVKLVNKGHVTGKVKGTDYYRASGFFDFFGGGGADLLYKEHKPNNIVKKFVVAKNLKPGEAKSFRVYNDYPPYFRSVSEFTKLYSH